MTTKRARVIPAVLLGVVGLALLEWVAAAIAYRRVVAPADWDTVAHAVAGLPPDAAVRVAEPWLMPQARAMLPTLDPIQSVGAPDLYEPRQLFVLGVQGNDWAPWLQGELQGRAAPIRMGATDHGGLTLTEYAWPAGAPVLTSFADDPVALRVSADDERCDGKRTFKCKSGRVRSRIAEIDYQPRRCLEIDVSDGTTVSMVYPNMQLGRVLRGHVGFGDFNARLRSDAPVRVQLRVSGESRARWIVTDAMGWHPVSIPTEPGVVDVELRVTVAVQGTWQRDGYAAHKSHAVCVELRALDEPEASPQ